MPMFIVQQESFEPYTAELKTIRAAEEGAESSRPELIVW
jgi:hypothetical protein